MQTTISTHFGSTVSLEHNRRDEKMIRMENEKWAKKYPGEVRIRPDGEYEILKDEGSLNEVYHTLFDDAVQDWNERQLKKGNKDRCINNYYSEIKAKDGKSEMARHSIYELIVMVGSRDAPLEKEMAVLILKEYYKDFEKRNPNLHVVMSALHLDEGTPHLHISIVPVAYNMSRGMHTQNSIKNALKQQGFIGDKKYDNVEMQWEKSENKLLEEICNSYGLEVNHYMAGKKTEHLSDEEYKLQKKIEKLQQELEEKKELPLGKTLVKKARLEELENTEKLYREKLPEIEQAKRDIHAAKAVMQSYSQIYTQLQKDKENFEEKVNQAANEKVKLLKDKALDFIRSIGLWDKFLSWSKKTIEKAKQRIHI